MSLNTVIASLNVLSIVCAAVAVVCAVVATFYAQRAIRSFARLEALQRDARRVR